MSSQGVSFDTLDAPGPGPGTFETALDDGASWDPLSAALFGQDLTFNAGVTDSSITGLTIQMQTNGNNEDIIISGVEIHGTPIPEPSRATLLSAGLAGALLYSRRRRLT